MKYSLLKTKQALMLSMLISVPAVCATQATQEQQDIMNRLTVGFIQLTHAGEHQWEEFTNLNNNMTYAWHLADINKTCSDLKNMQREFDARRKDLPTEFAALMATLLAENIIKIDAFIKILNEYSNSKNALFLGKDLVAFKVQHGNDAAIDKFHRDLMRLCLILKNNGASSAELLAQGIRDFINKHATKRSRSSIELLNVFAHRMSC